MMSTAMDAKPEITVLDDAAALADTAARAIVEIAVAAVAARRRFTVALAGGNTPRTTYERLAAAPLREQMPWDRTWIFFGDERAVPPDHPDSNYRMANAAQPISGQCLRAHVAISDIAHRHDRFAAELVPDPADAHVDDVSGRVEGVAPDVLEQLLPRARRAGVLHEVLQEHELAGRERDPAAVDLDHSAVEVE